MEFIELGKATRRVGIAMESSAAPVTFKKNRTRRNKTKRDIDTEPDATSGADADTGEDSPSVLATKLKNKLKTRTKPQSKLSFGGPDEVRSVSAVNSGLLILFGRKGMGKSSSSRSRN